MEDIKVKVEKLKKIINGARRIVVFTGAGISVASGIPDFRSADGLYNQNGLVGATPEEIISHTFFVNRTKDFYKFYFKSMVYETAQPNLAHSYFANLEKLGKVIAVVTQNIDGLHQKAGSKNVYELHGSVLRNNCTNCGRFHTLSEVKQSAGNTLDGVPRCKICGGIVKPDVVLYEESLLDDTVDGAINAIQSADTLIVVGTSLVVYPAAGFLRFFNGDNLVLINKDKTPYDSCANLVINDDIITTVQDLLGK